MNRVEYRDKLDGTQVAEIFLQDATIVTISYARRNEDGMLCSGTYDILFCEALPRPVIVAGRKSFAEVIVIVERVSKTHTIFPNWSQGGQGAMLVFITTHHAPCAFPTHTQSLPRSSNEHEIPSKGSTRRVRGEAS